MVLSQKSHPRSGVVWVIAHHRAIIKFVFFSHRAELRPGVEKELNRFVLDFITHPRCQLTVPVRKYVACVLKALYGPYEFAQGLGFFVVVRTIGD